jgi:hypothetical protein
VSQWVVRLDGGCSLVVPHGVHEVSYELVDHSPVSQQRCTLFNLQHKKSVDYMCTKITMIFFFCMYN